VSSIERYERCLTKCAAPKKKTKTAPAEDDEEDDEPEGDEEDDVEDEVDDEEVEPDDDDEGTAEKSAPSDKTNLKSQGEIPKEKSLAEVDDAE
jgi:hypothetical protein